MVKAIGPSQFKKPSPVNLRQALSGDKDLLKSLRAVDDAMFNKVAPAGLRGYLRTTAAGIKSEIPGDYKEARKGVHYRFVKRDKRTRQTMAKAGSQVGIKKARRETLGEQAQAKRGKRPGVGISVNNLHWAILGTSERQRKDGRRTGRMDPLLPGVVSRGTYKTRQQALAKFRELSKKELVRQVAKMRTKQGRR